MADAAAQAHTSDPESSVTRTRYTDGPEVVHPPRAPETVTERLPTQIGRYTVTGLQSDPEEYPDVTDVCYVAADEYVELKERHDGSEWVIRVVPYEPRNGAFAWACSIRGRRSVSITDEERAVEALADYLRGGDLTATPYYPVRQPRGEQAVETDPNQVKLGDL